MANELYVNPSTGFRSYFISFTSGTRLELMQRPGIPANANDTVTQQHLGLIHLALGMKSSKDVDAKAAEFRAAGLPILRGPRVTGEGYYEFETLDPDNNRIEISTTASS